MAKRSEFGQVRKLPSGRWQARYRLPGTDKWANGPGTFDTKQDARGWLTGVRADMLRGQWQPADRRTTLATYAGQWLEHRQLRPRTEALYSSQLDRLILPALGALPLVDLTPARVRAWFASLDRDKPTQRAHCYSLLKAICATAVADELLAANPCRVRGGGQVKRASKTEPATVDELTKIADSMPERYRLMVLLAAWCALRFGEAAELRRPDVDVKVGVLHVRRAVVVAGGQTIIGPPKSHAGIRDVAIPPHLIGAVKAHLRKMGANGGRDALLFPSLSDPTKHLAHTELHKRFKIAREAAGRPDLRFHDLRHSGAVWATLTGASLIEVMGRLGHSTPGAAMRYQSVAAGRDREIADALSRMAGE